MSKKTINLNILTLYKNDNQLRPYQFCIHKLLDGMVCVLYCVKSTVWPLITLPFMVLRASGIALSDRVFRKSTISFRKNYETDQVVHL
jgi:hypothetical protein